LVCLVGRAVILDSDPLCPPCSADKYNFEQAGLEWVPPKDRGFDVDGMPLDPNHPWNRENKPEG
jgi:hypothetical protein